jgi:glutamine synthetase
MKLSDYLTQANLTHGEFAVEIGTSQAAVTRYARGERIPRPEQMAAIAVATGGQVTANDFYSSVRPELTEEAAL